MTMTRILKRHTPWFIATVAFRRVLGLLTSDLRSLPDFIIIGAQRCGTTSLYNYLSQHGAIHPSFPKEIHYFTNHYSRGLKWYRSHYPLTRKTHYAGRTQGHGSLTGEATPYCIIHPHAPRRIAETAPEARLIALLRNPVNRAYSHYHYEVAMGAENLSFEAAIEAEAERVSGELPRLLKDRQYRSFSYQHHTYLARGIYVDQLRKWKHFRDRDQMLVLQSEDFYRDPTTILNRVTEFLGLQEWHYSQFRKHNHARYPPMEHGTRTHLEAYYRPYNQKLYDDLGIDFGWDNP